MTFFSPYTHIHLVGIKGVAMTALAQCLFDIGHLPTGSDVEEDFVTSEVLKKFGFNIARGFSPDHISPDVDLVIYTGAHSGKQNVEVQEAMKRGVPVMTHAEALGKLMEGKRGISVCGTGGKSTTSAMIAWILEYAGKKPSYAIGVGNVPNLERTGRYSEESEWFVAEADEYAVDPTGDHRPRFIYQHPNAIVCTNLDYDHPDIYKDFDQMKKTFSDFFETVEDCVYVNADNDVLLSIFTSLREQEKINFESCSVGFSEKSDYRLIDLGILDGNSKYRIEYTGSAERQPFVFGTTAWEGSLLIPGQHNIRNAGLAIVTVMNECDVKPEVAVEALATFASTMRRFEYKGKIGDVEMYDDYAHTPDEIHSTIQALREYRPGKRIVVAFQPHTYSRTKALFDGFVQELSQADEVILLDIFASAREAADPTVSSHLLASNIRNTTYEIHSYEELAQKLSEILKPGDVFISMGAGDIYKVYEYRQVKK